MRAMINRSDVLVERVAHKARDAVYVVAAFETWDVVEHDLHLWEPLNEVIAGHFIVAKALVEVFG